MRGLKSILPPDTITTRVDGWFGSPNRVPAAVARVMARNLPSIHSHNTVAAIRARVWRRQLAHERAKKHEHE
jgi:hypothetical protein